MFNFKPDLIVNDRWINLECVEQLRIQNTLTPLQQKAVANVASHPLYTALKAQITPPPVAYTRLKACLRDCHALMTEKQAATIA